MKNILFLVSGNGGNLKFINYLIKQKVISGIRLVVISDRECGALNFSRRAGLENYCISYSRDSPDELHLLEASLDIDLIITTWHKIVDDSFVEKYKGKIINSHYSILPAYAGLIGTAPVRAAMREGVLSGVTSHHVDKKLDGGKIINQAVVRLLEDKGEKEVFREVFLKGAVSLLCAMTEIMKLDFHVGNLDNFSPCLKYHNEFSPALSSELLEILSSCDDWLRYINNN